MIEQKLCDNNHKMTIDWETGNIADKPCTNIATTYTIGQYGIFYMCEECYKDDCKTIMDIHNIRNGDN